MSEELDSVQTVLRTEVRSAYSELTAMCESVQSLDEHIMRSALCISTYYACGGTDKDKAVRTAASLDSCLDALHLHDTVDSNGNVIVNHKRFLQKEFSTTKIIVAGDFMYTVGFIQTYGHVPELTPYLIEMSQSITSSIFDIVNREHDPEVTEEDCINILEGKFAKESEVIMKSAADLAKADERTYERMMECGKLLGTASRLSHEINDLVGDKGAQLTLMMGHPTLPIYYAMQDKVVGAEVKEMFSTKDLSPKEASRVAKLVKSTDSITKCRAIIDDCLDKAKSIINTLNDSIYRTALLQLADDLTL